MKTKLVLTIAVTAMLFACDENENDLAVPGAESELTLGNVEPTAQAEIQNKRKLLPISELLEISNGLLYTTDEAGQAIMFSDGELVCHSKFPKGEFEYTPIKQKAPSGFYQLPSGAIIHHHIDGVISTKVKIFQDCVEREVVVVKDCPPGHLGSTRLRIEDCYSILTGNLISSDTTVIGGTPCIPIMYPEIRELYFEDMYGNKYPNPICF